MMSEKNKQSIPYFETVSREPGCNTLSANTCEIIDFNLVVLRAGESYSFNTESREYGLVVLKGTVDYQINGQKFEQVGKRSSVFTQLPTCAYAGCGSEVKIDAREDAEVALASAISSTPIEPYLITQDQCGLGHWGEGNTLRHFRGMLGRDTPSERLWLTEVIVRDGRWATYPPHKHEDVPGDLFQEEMYYYRVSPEEGFGFCAEFEGLVGADCAYMIRNSTIHKMPHGYHTVVSAPGYQIYYLAVYAGRDKGHQPSPHPAHVNAKSNPMPNPFI